MEEIQEFSISQVYEFRPCQVYEVSTLISMLEDQPIPYWAYVKVKAKRGSGPVPAVDFLERVGEGLEHLGNDDIYTAVYRTRQVVRARVGLHTRISLESKPIRDCIRRMREVEKF